MKKWRTFMNTRAWIIVPVLCLVAAAAFCYVFIFSDSSKATATATVPSCESPDMSSSFDCWQSRYKAMVDTQSPEAAFADIKKAYDTNPYIKSNCHQLGHVIGRESALKFKTLAETYKHGDQFCWSGYYHGAIETVAKNIGPDKIVAQMTSVCADFMKTKPYGFDHYNCVHGMGHGLMAVEDGELFKSLKICDNYTDNWEAQSCYSGVFMENVMNEINPGKHSNYLKADDPLYPCTAVETRYEEQCYLMQTSHALTVVSYDYNKVFELCTSVNKPYDATCFQSLGRDISGNSTSDQTLTVERCSQGPSSEAIENCFTGAVKDFISYYRDDTKGLAMCAAITDTVQSDNCTAVGKAYYQNL